MSYSDDSISSESSNPLGSFEDLKPSFKRQVKALFKKSILQKIRKKSAIIEILVSFLLVIICWVAFNFSTVTTPPNEYPQVQPIISELMKWFMMQDVQVILMSKNDLLTELLNNTVFLRMGTYGGEIDIGRPEPLRFPGAKLQYLTI